MNVVCMFLMLFAFSLATLFYFLRSTNTTLTVACSDHHYLPVVFTGFVIALCMPSGTSC